MCCPFASHVSRSRAEMLVLNMQARFPPLFTEITTFANGMVIGEELRFYSLDNYERGPVSPSVFMN